MSHTKSEFEMLEAVAARSVFPFSCKMGEGGEFSSNGLTKRELFAAMALQGILADETVKADQRGMTYFARELGAQAVCLADGLLYALTDEQQLTNERTTP